jgi:ubiquinone/menaquinone biosynthesis C-methylase UbiE
LVRVSQQGISAEAARRFYDRLGALHDWADAFEARAKGRALEQLDLRLGLRVLEVGVGTGRDHARMVAQVGGGDDSRGLVVGIDLSPVMLRVTQTRARSPLCLADARQLPFADASFDRLFCAYVLDLLPARDLTIVLREFRRVLKPDGRAALVSLTEGVTFGSHLVITAWKLAYSISPIACGGCRPLLLRRYLADAGLDVLRREVVVQLGVPSEITIVAP